MALDTNDYSTNGNNMTNNNGATEYTASLPFGDSSTAAAFASGSSQYLSIADTAQTGLDFSSPWDFTFETWINFDNLPDSTWHSYCGKGDPSSGGSYSWRFLRIGGTNYYVKCDVTDDGIALTRQSWNWQPSADTWYHNAISWDASAGKNGFLFYVGASSQGAGSNDSDGSVTSLYNNAVAFGVASFSGAAASQVLDGRLDDFRIWSDIRTSTEISNNYQNELTGSEANLELYLPFEDVSVGFSGNQFIENNGLIPG